MKEWRKMFWARGRAFIQLRLSELRAIGVEIGKRYDFRVIPQGKKLVIEFKKKWRRRK